MHLGQAVEWSDQLGVIIGWRWMRSGQANAPTNDTTDPAPLGR